jgi:hypothetical protein
MAGTDFIRSTRETVYHQPGSPAEEALTEAMPGITAAEGPVNFIWNQPSRDTLRHIWPDA